MAAVARSLHGWERVAALTVAGSSPTSTSRDPDAGCAFDAAREEAALHPLSNTRLLGLVEQALEVGLHPTKLRTLSGTGVGIMRRDFGVELPAPGNDCL